MIYLDASALVTLICERNCTAALRAFVASRPGIPMGTSTIRLVETVRTLDRIGDYPSAISDLVGRFTEILLTEEVRDAAAGLPGKLRTLDAVHVASAQVVGPVLDTLVSYDRRVLEVAHAVGLPTAAPGLDGTAG